MSGQFPPVCILAGGLGTRLGPLTLELPKGLIDIDGEPFLIHQIRELARQGVTEVVLCVGYRGEMIEECLREEVAGVTLAYSYDGPGLDGTLGAIRRAAHLLGEEFFVLYGDTILAVDYAAARSAWVASGAPAFMSVLRNTGQWDRSNAEVRNGFVVAYDKFSPTPAMGWIDYGLSGLTRPLLDRCPEKNDLAFLWREVAERRELCAFEVQERFYEIGSPAALEETRKFLAARRGQRR